LYFRVGRRVPDDSDPEVVALSELLNALPIHAERPDQARFRNPNGVALKLANFRALDQPGHGMSRGGKRDQEVWKEFSPNPDQLHRLVEAIRAGHSLPTATADAVAIEDDDESEFPEGRVIYRLHRARERNRAVVEKKKAVVLQRTGRLACEVCSFDFGATYGPAGDGYIECHHAAPLAHVADTTVTRVQDPA